MSSKLEISFPRLYYFGKRLVRIQYKCRVHFMTMDMKMKRNATLYYRNIHEKLDWNNLKTYNEIMQWEKMFDDDPRKAKLSDKYEVRNWVAKKIGEEYLVPLLGVWDNAKDIDFELLPNSFVLKTNCGTGDVIIIKEKERLTKKELTAIRCKLNYYLHYDCSCNSFEMHYANITPKIICEQLLEYPGTDVPDYKFMCFHDKPYFCWVDTGRYHDHRRIMVLQMNH